MIESPLPLLGFAGFSGSGKTTLLRAVLPLLVRDGLRVGMIKHAHHNFDIDQPGKDSYELRKAGARQMLVASSKRWALMNENDVERDPDLNELIAHLDHKRLDLILVEGFKHVAFPKIEVHRPALGHPLLSATDPSVIAIACDAPPANARVALLDINSPESIATFVRDYARRRTI